MLARITRNETVIKLDHAYFGLEEVVPRPTPGKRYSQWRLVYL